MALNPFFLQGSPNEQRLVQELINEQLRIYGVEVIYIPRKFVRKETILKEISASKFDDNYAIEAYVDNFDGYTGSGDILTKFGMSLKDEINLVISKERFEDFIAPLNGSSSYIDENELIVRPKEGDLIYFPLGQRLFEVKFVEHEKPFYQLGKLYVYELKCELFEYEDEVIETTIDEIDTQIEDQGYITTIQLIGSGSIATANAIINTGYIKDIFINNDGYGYTSNPIVDISPSPVGGTNASAVAITTERGGVYSIQSIELINAGAGYTVAPTIIISGGGGSGAAATCSIETSLYGVTSIQLVDYGSGYAVSPNVNIIGDVGAGQTATVRAIVGTGQTITSIRIRNSGIGYTVAPDVVVDNPPILLGVGDYKFNEIITGSVSGTTGRVKSWDLDTKVLKVSFVDNAAMKGFYPGEIVTGSSSGAYYSVKSYNEWDQYDKYSENIQIEDEAQVIVDFSESNPFGTF